VTPCAVAINQIPNYANYKYAILACEPCGRNGAPVRDVHARSRRSAGTKALRRAQIYFQAQPGHYLIGVTAFCCDSTSFTATVSVVALPGANRRALRVPPCLTRQAAGQRRGPRCPP
jgi:hypothetical protein